MNNPTTDPTSNEDSNNKTRLKAAVRSGEVPPFLDAKIRHRIEEQAQARPRRAWGMLAVAGVAAALMVGGYQIGSLRNTAEDQESFIVSVTTKVATLMRVGLSDHIHCAFFRTFPEQAPAKEEMESALGQEYKELIPVVQKYVPKVFTLVASHHCRYNGREFVHLTLKSDTQLLSLVVAAKRAGESFNVEGILPELVQSGVPVYNGGADRFQIAAMETSNHLVYFISDLSGQQNLQLMQSMVASLKSVLENIQG
jgi:hypothetical protein